MLTSIVLLTCILCAWWLAHRKPAYGLYLLSAALTLRMLGDYGFGLNNRVPFALGIGFVLGWYPQRKKDEIPLANLFGCFLLVAILSAFQSYWIPPDAVVIGNSFINQPWIKSITRLFLLCLMMLTLWASFDTLREHSTRLQVSRIITASIILSVLYATLHASYGAQIGNWVPTILHTEQSIRLRAFTSEPSMFANFLIAMIPFVGYGILHSKRWERMYFSIGGATLLLGVIFSVSRGAWLALLVGAVGAALLYAIKRDASAGIRLVSAGLLLSIIFLGIFTYAAPSHADTLVWEPIHGITDTTSVKVWSTKSRIIMLRYASQAFLSHPLLGVGYENYNFYSGNEYYPALSPQPINWPEPNNLPAKVLAEMGILGFAIFSLLCYRIIQETLGDHTTQGMLNLWAVSALAIQFMFLSQIHYIYYWVLLGFILPRGEPINSDLLKFINPVLNLFKTPSAR